MKKLLLISSFILTSILTVNAQYFVGGSFNFRITGGKETVGNTTTDKNTQTSFTFAPKGGMFLSDKLLVGLELGYSIYNDKTPSNPKQIDRTTTFGISPFTRYYAFKLNKFSLFAQGNVGAYFGMIKYIDGSTTTKGPKTTSFSLVVSPGISYDLNDKISLEATINGLNFGMYTTTINDNGDKNVTNSFGFGASLDGIVNTGNISIGAIVKF